jgi:quinol monooxygenase YgiN
VIRHPVVELRQYTLKPGRRDELIALFDQHFVETQEAVGAAVVGQFRDLDDPDRFVWLRGFAGMAQRQAALEAFYTGPHWKAHGAQANATMLDVSNVLLLRPSRPDNGFADPGRRDAAGPTGVITATIWYGDEPFDDGGPVPSIASLRTLYAANTFPALPVREGEHALVLFGRAGDPDPVAPPSVTAIERLRLAPTGRSALR